MRVDGEWEEPYGSGVEEGDNQPKKPGSGASSNTGVLSDDLCVGGIANE